MRASGRRKSRFHDLIGATRLLRLLARGPVLDDNVLHREVPRVAGREPRAHSGRGSGDQAVGLRERHAAVSMLAAPGSGPGTLGCAERRDVKPHEEQPGPFDLGVAEPAHDLFDIDSGRVGQVVRTAQRREPLDRAGSSTEHVDQYGRVEEDGTHSADPPRVGVALRQHPGGRVGVPGVRLVVDRADRLLDQRPALLVLQRKPRGALDEPAATARPDTGVQPLDELVIEVHVNSQDHYYSTLMDTRLDPKW